jgi:predicted metalloendopeptidase
LKDGFKQYINEQASWMNDQATKQIARDKLNALTAAIGYASIASNDEQLDKYYEKVRYIVDLFSLIRFHLM